MKIQLNTDSNVQSDPSLVNHVETVLDGTLGRFRDQISRVEVHVRDTNGSKSGGNDKHCTMEARLEGRQPLSASDDAATVRDAISGAARKLRRVVDSTLDKMSH